MNYWLKITNTCQLRFSWMYRNAQKEVSLVASTPIPKNRHYCLHPQNYGTRESMHRLSCSLGDDRHIYLPSPVFHFSKKGWRIDFFPLASFNWGYWNVVCNNKAKFILQWFGLVGWLVGLGRIMILSRCIDKRNTDLSVSRKTPDTGNFICNKKYLCLSL